MKLLEGKVAIITGASRGIGKGIEVFLQTQTNVAFTYSSSVESALALENELNALELKPKDTNLMLPILMKHKLWLMLY
jgi:3-oxoacyl-[acyl-carrier protein] reductase